MTTIDGPVGSARQDSELSLLHNVPLLALGIGHGAVDLCANVLPVFYPVIMSSFHLSYASAGALMTVQSTFSSLSQPFFGWLSDRFGSRWIAALCVLGTAVAIALAGYMPDYPWLLATVALLGLGVGAYHPQAAKGASVLGGRWRTTALSIYMVLGSVGYAAGPLLAATVLAPGGLHSTTFLLLPGMLVASLLFTTVGRVDRLGTKRGGRELAAPADRIAWAGAAALATVIVARSWVTNGLVAFLPLLYASRHQDARRAGEVLFLLILLEGGGTALGGWLADRFGRKITLVISFALLAPTVHLFVGAEGALAAVLAMALGVLVGCSVTITLAAAQELLPSRMGMASGMAISLSQIMGAAGVGAQGLLADRYGLAFSMETLVAATVLAGVASVGIGGRRRGT